MSKQNQHFGPEFNDTPLYGPASVSFALRGMRLENGEGGDGTGTGGEPKDDPKDDPKDGEDLTSLKSALATERTARRAAEKKIADDAKEAQKKADAELSEVDRLKKELAEKDGELSTFKMGKLRADAAKEAKLPTEWANRISGDTYEDMLADAKELVKLVPGAKPPKADPSQGRKQDPSGLNKRDQFVDTIDDLFGK